MGTERARRLEREGQARARLDAALPQLAPGLRRGVRDAGRIGADAGLVAGASRLGANAWLTRPRFRTRWPQALVGG